MAPLASIIINNYNYARFLGEAIDSALAQTYPHCEVIVVDDGSTDNSREVMAGYGELIIPVLKENGGQASAFNAGFLASNGEWILFLDSDDVLNPCTIETVARHWRVGVGRLQFSMEIVSDGGEPTGVVIGGKVRPSLKVGPFGIGSPTSGNVFWRTLLEKVMPVPEIDWRISADIYLSAVSLFGETVCMEECLGKYRVHGGNNHFGGGGLSVSRKSIHRDLRLHAELVRLAGGQIGSLEKWLGTCPEHWIQRIKSLREKPDDHPWPDTILGLTARSVKATWCRPGWGFPRKVGYTAFALAYGLLPRGLTLVLRKVLRKVDGPDRGRTYKRLFGT